MVVGRGVQSEGGVGRSHPQLMHHVGKEEEELHVRQALSGTLSAASAVWQEVVRDIQHIVFCQEPAVRKIVSELTFHRMNRGDCSSVSDGVCRCDGVSPFELLTFWGQTCRGWSSTARRDARTRR